MTSQTEFDIELYTDGIRGDKDDMRVFSGKHRSWNTTLALPLLQDVIYNIYSQPQCKNIPVFMTMAAVGSDLYWQLIENFVYSLVKFELIDCGLVICVSDPKCMNLCSNALFPCYDYQYDPSRHPSRPVERLRSGKLASNIPSVMEQIAIIKLFEIPKALAQGVDVFMLDLDVGFLADPMPIVDTFVATRATADILVQEDMIFIMNRSRAGWKTWFTEQLPNIGLFICRGNVKTVKVFDIAWQKYQKMPDLYLRSQPGKDQNHVLDAMRRVRAFDKLKYAYLPNTTAVLMDKMHYVNRTIELGGEVSEGLLAEGGAFAAHATCYEHQTKVLGLKAVNAFWNPLYYDPLRPTITKQLLYLDEKQILDETRSLVWLSLITNRSLITPNILGEDYLYEKIRGYRGRTMWPGFRVTKFKQELKANILEPGFYWRVKRDYADVPEPRILFYDPKIHNLYDIYNMVLAARNEVYSINKYVSFYQSYLTCLKIIFYLQPRLVLHPVTLPRHFIDSALNGPYGLKSKIVDEFSKTQPIISKDVSEKKNKPVQNVLGPSKQTELDDIVHQITNRVIKWAKHSVGEFEGSYRVELNRYDFIPSVKSLQTRHWGSASPNEDTCNAYNRLMNPWLFEAQVSLNYDVNYVIQHIQKYNLFTLVITVNIR